MRVIAFDPYVPRERGKEMGVELMPTLEALLVQADFLTIHLPRTPDTEGLIGERELALMKEGARLVNTARGGIVDEQALAKALEEGKLAGAALDVFEQEPAEDRHCSRSSRSWRLRTSGPPRPRRRTRPAPRSPRWCGSR